MRKWTCPRCEDTILAPDRPRKDDVRRYCLPCSEKTGRLVERACPARERERERKKRQRSEAAKRKRAADREKRLAAKAKQRRLERGAGINLPAEFKRLQALFPKLRRTRFEVKAGHGGSYGCRSRVTLRPAGLDTLGRVCLLAHEVAHALHWTPVNGRSRARDDAPHGLKWRRAYARVLKEAYSVEVSTLCKDGYVFDKRVKKALVARWEGKTRTPWRK